MRVLEVALERLRSRRYGAFFADYLLELVLLDAIVEVSIARLDEHQVGQFKEHHSLYFVFALVFK